MTREEMASALLREQHGYDPDTSDSFGADDPMSQAGLSTISVRFQVANAASLSVDLFAQTALDLVALPTGLIAPDIATYKSWVRYLAANPSQLRSLLLQTSEPTNNAPLLSSMILTPTRKNMWGLVAQNTKLVQTYQTTADFQGNRVTVPLTQGIDTISYLNVASGVNNSGAAVDITAAILFGQRKEARKGLANARPLTVRPGGRGPAIV